MFGFAQLDGGLHSWRMSAFGPKPVPISEGHQTHDWWWLASNAGGGRGH